MLHFVMSFASIGIFCTFFTAYFFCNCFLTLIFTPYFYFLGKAASHAENIISLASSTFFAAPISIEKEKDKDKEKDKEKEKNEEDENVPSRRSKRTKN